MERYIKERWLPDMLQDISARFGTTPRKLTMLDGFESFIYEYERDGKYYILRVSHSDNNRRNINLINGEMDWLDYLAKGGAQVTQVIKSDAGNLVESIADGRGEAFFATAFEKAAGDHLGWDKWTPEFMQHYGATIGRIHRLSKTYTPSNPAWRRYEWDNPVYVNVDKLARPDDPEITQKMRDTLARLQALARDDGYHMIHQDAHGGNFFVDAKGHITLFDFDDCCYGHAIYDIAMVIFYGPIRYNPAMAKTFASHFFIGYARENALDARWLPHIVDFMRLRELDLYLLIERDIDWRNGEDPWAVEYMKGRRERLLNDMPFVDFDFTSLAHLLA